VYVRAPGCKHPSCQCLCTEMTGDLALGYSCCLIAGVGFGINYLPVKGIDTGDGIFFSAVMSVGILAVGLVTGMVLSSPPGLLMPKFEPWAAFGGAIWMCGNLMCPYIIKLIGMGLGLTVWDLSNMIMGWFTGHYGLFGVQKEHIDRPRENSVGLGMAVLSLVFFSLAASFDAKEGGAKMDTTDETREDAWNSEEDTASTAFPASVGSESDLEIQIATPAPQTVGKSIETKKTPGSPQDQMTPCQNSDTRNFAIGLNMALVAGVFFGTTFDLPTALMEGRFGDDHSGAIMDYVFSHFCGIFAAASAALVVYSAVMRERRYMPRRMILPAIASGILWGIAQVAWFQANIDLGFSVAFPIIGSLTGIVGLIVGMAFFGEVKSNRGRLWSFVGLALRLPGVVLIAIST